MFAIGNVVKLPYDDSFYVVAGERHLIPFDYFNATVYPPEEDRYGTRESLDGDDNLVEEVVLLAHGIDKYEYVAATIDEFIVSRIRMMMYGT